MTEHSPTSFEDDMPPISDIDGERLALLDIHAAHEARLLERPANGGMSLAEKAALEDARRAAAILEGVTDGMRAQYPPEDFQYEPWVLNNPNDTLLHVYMTQGLAVDSMGVEHSIPVIRLDRPEEPLTPDELERTIASKGGVTFHHAALADVPMAQLLDDGSLMPTGDFTPEDVAVGRQMVEELVTARMDGTLPHLRATDLAHINDPARADLYWQIQQHLRQQDSGEDAL